MEKEIIQFGTSGFIIWAVAYLLKIILDLVEKWRRGKMGDNGSGEISGAKKHTNDPCAALNRLEHAHIRLEKEYRDDVKLIRNYMQDMATKVAALEANVAFLIAELQK